MKNLTIVIGIIIAILAAVYLMGTDVDVNDAGKLPSVDVDVDAEAGRLPDVTVNTPDIDVNMKKKTVEIPTGVEIKTEKKSFGIPNVDFNAANDSVIDEAAEGQAAERE